MPKPTIQSRPRILTKRGLIDLGITYSNVHLIRMEKASQFPTRLRLSQKTVGWLESEVLAWILDRAAARKGN
ncbi:MAG: AlpA family phage regulatory protein [Alphaproteobacteria bacterium]|nr:AlpA family phage regulatory protein [Alphaproteobacteria bacterium]